LLAGPRFASSGLQPASRIMMARQENKLKRRLNGLRFTMNPPPDEMIDDNLQCQAIDLWTQTPHVSSNTPHENYLVIKQEFRGHDT